MKLNKIIAEVKYDLESVYKPEMMKWKKLKSQIQKDEGNNR